MVLTLHSEVKMKMNNNRDVTRIIRTAILVVKTLQKLKTACRNKLRDANTIGDIYKNIREFLFERVYRFRDDYDMDDLIEDDRDFYESCMENIQILRKYINEEKEYHTFISRRKADISRYIDNIGVSFNGGSYESDLDHICTFADRFHILVNYLSVNVIGNCQEEENILELYNDRLDELLTATVENYRESRNSDPDDIEEHLFALKFLNKTIHYFMEGSIHEDMTMGDLGNWLGDLRAHIVVIQRDIGDDADVQPEDFDNEVAYQLCREYFKNLKEKLLNRVVG